MEKNMETAMETGINVGVMGLWFPKIRDTWTFTGS